MQLTKESLEQKIADLTQETIQFAQSEQAAVNGIQQALQNRIREAQKGVDNREGKLQSYKDLLKDLYPEPSTPDSENEKPVPLHIA